MAYKNKFISNAVTRQDILFLQTSKDTLGSLLEMQSTYHGNSKQPVDHYHPFQEEKFKVLEGELTVILDGEKRILKKNDTLHILPGQHHSMWNASGGKTVINWRVMPAMETEYLLETFVGLANDNKTDSDGKPGLMQTIVTIRRFENVFRLTHPSFVVQETLFSIIARIGYLIGYRGELKKYID